MADFTRNEIIKMLMNNNFNGINISGLNLSNLDLSGLDFSKSNIRNSNFTNSDLSSAIFNSANITNCNFQYTCFNGANFDNSKLNNLKIEFRQDSRKDLENFKVSKIYNATFNTCEFTGIISNTRNFETLPHCSTTFEGCSFEKVDFTELRLTDFWSCKFYDVEFTNSTLHDFYNSTFTDVEFINSNGNYRNFGGSISSTETGFYGCKLEFIKLVGTSETPFYLKSDFQHLDSLTDLHLENVYVRSSYLAELKSTAINPKILNAFEPYKIGRVGKIGNHNLLERK